MAALRSPNRNPFNTPFSQASERGREDWEDWEDEVSSTDDSPKDEPLIDLGTKNKPVRLEPTQYSVPKPSRLKSRARQKAQNARAGIKVVTDMSDFRKQQHVAHQLRSAGAGDRRTGKFVDAAALRALEGTPTESSVGNWAWLRRKPTNKGLQKSPQKGRRGKSAQDLSPADRPIVIGIAMPENDLANKVISPQTAVVETPRGLSKYIPRYKKSAAASVSPMTPHDEPRSFWSPDTEMSSPDPPSRVASSIYSQYGGAPENGYVPPVPVVPSNYKQQRRNTAELENDDDNTSPATLFEEDGSPTYTRKVSKKKGHSRSPATMGTLSGWWDHVKTPFVEQAPNAFTPMPTSPVFTRKETADEWWKGVDEKKATASPGGRGLGISTITSGAPSPSIASSSRYTPSQPVQPTQSHSEKARILAEESRSPIVEQPPPYEPAAPKKEAVRYRAIFPPDHPLSSRFPPSPGPASPGLTYTMTSQGAISMTNVPLTPARAVLAPGGTPLPDRPQGTFAPDHRFANAVGNSEAAKVERRRQRHEKEDAFARRVEGFWKGRGCISAEGCYGRRGREGRKRRRICLGIIGGVIAAIILLIVLLVVLLRKNVAPVPGAPGAPATTSPDNPYSFWLNITNFPPIPTGVTTVIGPDNTETVSGCVAPATMWSCSLPKELQKANEPYRPEQPNFVIQIQYDNNTRELWKVPDGPIPSTGDANQGVRPSKRSGPVAVLDLLRSLGRRAADPTQVFDAGITPSPSPPPFREYWFLGNTTDGITADRKAGEPTPFYLSFLPAVDAPNAGPNMLQRRGLGNGITTGPDGNLSSILPPPVLNLDGTGAAAVMHPRPIQQPLRLFDRGLPTEHFGFYSFFDKSIYTKAIGQQNETTVPESDKDGGSLEKEASWIVTFTQTRFHVQIWTRMQDSSQILGTKGTVGDNTTRPGTFPYPITLSEDTHGGDFNAKGAFARRVDSNQKIVLENPVLVTNRLDFGSPLINHGLDPDQGGFDGGKGGCKCAWTNFVNVKKGGS